MNWHLPSSGSRQRRKYYGSMIEVPSSGYIHLIGNISFRAATGAAYRLISMRQSGGYRSRETDQRYTPYRPADKRSAISAHRLAVSVRLSTKTLQPLARLAVKRAACWRRFLSKAHRNVQGLQTMIADRSGANIGRLAAPACGQRRKQRQTHNARKQ